MNLLLERKTYLFTSLVFASLFFMFLISLKIGPNSISSNNNAPNSSPSNFSDNKNGNALNNSQGRRTYDFKKLKAGKDYVENEIVIRLKSGVNEKQLASINKKFSLKIKSKIPQLNAYTLTIKSNKTVPELTKALNKITDIKYAEPNFIVKVDRVPNDPYWATSGSWGQSYDDLWGLKKIQAEQAWDISTGSSAVAVAVIDTGIDFTHEDLQGQIWTNLGETGIDSNGQDKRTNGIDDDSNGYVDDWRGWDFTNNDNNPTDDNGHGTHVAGTIGATGNNGVGVVGVNWNVKIAAVKFLGAGGSGTFENGAKSLIYAAELGIPISNNSWGGSRNQLIDDAVAYAYTKGQAVVVAAGNENTDANTRSPAGAPDAITIAATDYQDNKASFSNYGSKIDVAAPGVQTLSLRASGTTMGTPVGNNYTVANGTSMATPHVSGLAALLLSVNPSLTNENLRTIIRESSDDLGATGRDDYYGYGRINAKKALDHPLTSYLLVNHQPAPGSSIANTLPLISASFSDSIQENPNSIQMKLDGSLVNHSYDAVTRQVSYQVSTALSEGSHIIEISVDDNAGNNKIGRWDFQIDTTAPNLTNTTPADGSTVNTAKPTLAANFSDASNIKSVRLLIDGTDYLPVVNFFEKTIKYTPQTDLTDGQHNAIIEITDQALNKSTASWTFNVAQPPSIVGYQPQEWINNDMPLIKVQLYDNSAINEQSINLTLNGQIVPHIYDPITQEVVYQVNKVLNQGVQNVLLSARDLAGLPVNLTWNFYVDSNAPTLSELTPLPDSTIDTSWPTITAVVTENGVGIKNNSVVSFVDGLLVASKYDQTLQKILITAPDLTLLDGNHSVEMRISDNLNNEGQNNWSFNVSAPFGVGKLTASNIPLGFNNTISYNLNQSATINTRIYDANNTLVRNLENNTAHGIGNTKVFWDGKDDTGNLVTVGTYKVEVEASNNQGITASASTGFDAINHTLAFTNYYVLYPFVSPNNDETNPFIDVRAGFSRSVTATLSLYDANGVLVKTVVKEAFGGSVVFNLDGFDLIDGKYRIIIRGEDSQGDYVTTENDPLKYVYVAREPIKIVDPIDGSALNSPSEKITTEQSPYFVKDLAYNGYAGVTFYFRLKGATEWYPQTFGSQNSGRFKYGYWDTTSLPDGYYELMAMANFWATGWNEYSPIASYTLDKTAPDTPSNLTGASDTNQVNLSWTASTDTTSGVKEYEIERSTNGTDFANIGITTQTSYSDTGLSLGTYYYKVRAVDNAGNLSSYSDVVSVALADTIPPTTDISISGTMGSSNYYVSKPMATLNASDNAEGSGLAGSEYSFDGINWNSYLGPITIINEGQTTIYYRSTDNAGNIETTKQISVKVDTEKPINITNLSAVPNTSNQVVISWDASTDVTSGIKEYALEKSTDNTTFSEIARVTSTTYTDSVSSVGVYYYRVKAIDNASNESDYASGNTTITNNLLNSSFELDTDSNGIPDNWDPIFMSAGDGRSADYAKEGSNSLKIVGDTNVLKHIKQDLNISGNVGDVLALTGFNKTIGASSTGGIIQATLYLTYADGTQGSASMTWDKNTHDWTEKAAVITAAKNFTSARVIVFYFKQTGTGYFDDFRLDNLGPMNILQNSSFELDTDSNGIPDNWDTIFLSAGDGRSADYAKEGSNSFKIVGDTNILKHTKQDLNISGNVGDVLALSGFNKTVGASSTGGDISAKLYLNYTDGTYGSTPMTFNKDTHDWTEGSLTMTAAKDFTSARVIIFYLKQTGTGYFDDFRLLAP